MTSMLAGRDSERLVLGGFLDSVTTRMGGALLTGPSGIGKTALWKATIADAEERGYLVRTSRPTEVETQLPFAALTDLLRGLDVDALDSLPGPQREALQAAMFRVRTKRPARPLAVALAVGHVLRVTAERTPVLLAIDDVSWIDPASERVLEFALRRLEGEALGLLMTHRTPSEETPAPTLSAAVPADRLVGLEVGPLSLEATNQLLRAAGIDLLRPALKRVHAATGGNPFFALEIGRDLANLGTIDSHQPLRVPDRLSELLGSRIAAVSPGVSEVLLFVSALTHPTLPVVEKAVGRAVGPRLRAAISAGILELDGEAIRFTHPLFAAQVYGQASEDHRSKAHRRLAHIVVDPEERATHLARSAVTRDEAVASTLEDAAELARARGAPEAAADLSEKAAALTPPKLAASRRRRRLAAAQDLMSAGDLPDARARLEGLAAEIPPGPERADVLVHLANVLLFTGERAEAEKVLQRAAADVGRDARRRVRIESSLAGVAYLTWRGWRAGAAHIAEAKRLADEVGDDVLRFETIGHYATWQFALGHGLRTDLVDTAEHLRRRTDDIALTEHPDLQFAAILCELGDVEGARRRLRPLVVEARNRADWNSLPMLLMQLARVEMSAGDWDHAASLFAEAANASQQTGQEPGNSHGWPDELLALRGDAIAAHLAATAELEWADRTAQPWIRRTVVAALGLLELSRADPAAAEGLLAPMASARFPGWTEPAVQRSVLPVHAEALIGLGRLDEAEVVLGPFERAARARGRRRALADALRSRALLQGARQDVEHALATIDNAIALLRSFELPFDLARTLLAAGEIRRRARKKALAREVLEESVEIFLRLGAVRWAERAAAELARTGVRRQAASGLTNAQRQVADLVARGRTNRQIADALFISVHTVEAHLSSVYRALRIRSRTDLARVILADGIGGSDPAASMAPERDGSSN
jgi:DNA-binding CsgD family transcriptional regulator